MLGAACACRRRSSANREATGRATKDRQVRWRARADGAIPARPEFAARRHLWHGLGRTRRARWQVFCRIAEPPRVDDVSPRRTVAGVAVRSRAGALILFCAAGFLWPT